MEVPLLQGTKPVTTTSAWIRGGWTGGAPDASALAPATAITSRRPLLEAMGLICALASCSLYVPVYLMSAANIGSSHLLIYLYFSLRVCMRIYMTA